MSISPTRVGMFGGAFDPPHNAHVALARAAVQQLNLDELHIIPTGQAWHKARELAPAEHRLTMTRLAFGDVPKTVVDERELRRLGPSYTLETLRELQQLWPQAQLLLLLGADQLQDLPYWHQAEEIAGLATICVAGRVAATDTKATPRRYSGSAAALNVKPLLLQLPRSDTSSSQIRRQAALGQDIATLVPLPVARYIAQHHLYTTH